MTINQINQGVSVRTLVIGLVLAATLPAAAAAQWQVVPGVGRDIGIGHNGGVWLIGSNSVGGGYGIYQYDGANWIGRPGGAVRIAVGPQQSAWVVNNVGQIYLWAGNQWQERPGRAIDIAVSARGVHWINPEGRLMTMVDENGYQAMMGSRIQEQRCNNFRAGPPRYQRVAAAPNGDAWVIVAEDAAPGTFVVEGREVAYGPGSVFRYPAMENRCWLLGNNASARDIGIGGNGQVWVIGTNAVGGGWGIYRYQCDSATAGMPGGPAACWLGIPGGAAQISVHQGGKAWLVNATGSVIRYM